MELSELEVLIGWTHRDLQEGFFFATFTCRLDCERFIRRIGGKQSLLEYIPETALDGRFLGAVCKVPTRYLSTKTFSIRTPSTVGRIESQKRNSEIATARLAAMRKAKAAATPK